jgi:hypothetical protein
MTRIAAILTAVMMAAAAVAAAESLRIVPIVHDTQLLVSFEMADAYTDEIRDAIASGLQMTFDYDVQVRMVVPAWVDRTIATATISTTVKYDNLTRRHTLSRSVDGRIQETTVTGDEMIVRKWLTTLTRLPVCPASRLEADRDYYVRINARVRPNRGSFLGWAKAVSGQTKFTFVP